MADENILWRAQTYALLASLLVQPPSKELLANLAAIDVTEPDSPMGTQWSLLVAAAEQADVDAIHDEFQRLFVGVTHGELMPYGSYYQTGFLMEEPLAVLRTDLARLGLERHEEKNEPEDHAAAECDVMRLILMAEGTPVVTAEDFFQQHIQPWMEQFVADLAKAENAAFYRIIGSFAQRFISLETKLFS